MEKKREKTDLTNNIREKARELWEKDGCKQDRDLGYWLQAEKIVKGQMKKIAVYLQCPDKEKWTNLSPNPSNCYVISSQK